MVVDLPCVADSGSEGLVSLESPAPDLVLVDVELPDMDGFEFTRVAKSNGGTYRVVLMIALETSRFQEWARRAGADHAMEKSRLHTNLPPLLAHRV